MACQFTSEEIREPCKLNKVLESSKELNKTDYSQDLFNRRSFEFIFQNIGSHQSYRDDGYDSIVSFVRQLKNFRVDELTYAKELNRLYNNRLPVGYIPAMEPDSVASNIKMIKECVQKAVELYQTSPILKTYLLTYSASTYYLTK